MTEHLRHDPRQHEPLLRRDNRPYAASVFYDRTQSYAIVFTAITVALLISAALTALLEPGSIEDQLSADVFPENSRYILRNTEAGWAHLEWFHSISTAQISDLLTR